MPGLSAVVLVASLTLAPPQAPSTDSLDAVRQLYASAEYESALGALDRLGTSSDTAEATEAERFRALCLMALGRTADAEMAIERIVRNDPSYHPDEQEPPRVRAAFTAVRGRVLPDVARAIYADGKAAYDRRDYPVAAAAFSRAVAVLDGIESDDPDLGDLQTLATGFLDLSRAAIAPPAAAPVPTQDPAPVSPTATSDPPPEQGPGAPPTADTSRGPEPIEQVLPPWNPAWSASQLPLEFQGAVEVVIDEHGIVTSARIVDPIHPGYDTLLLEAAARWRYRPAQARGLPIASTKRVNVVLRPRN